MRIYIDPINHYSLCKNLIKQNQTNSMFATTNLSTPYLDT